MSKSAASKTQGKGGSKNNEVVDQVINKLKNKKEEEEEEEEEGDEEEDDEEGDDLSNLPKQVLKRVVAIRKMHTAVEALDAEYKKERIALEQKYLALKAPINAARDQIISGEVEAPADTEAPDAASAEVEAEEEKVSGIPGFWLQCLGAHHITGDLICEDDVPLLEALTGIKCDYDEAFTSFTLTFSFAENEYFTNKTLTKKYGVSPDLLDEKAPALTSNEGSQIDWKAGKNLTVTEIKKKQKAKSGKNKGQVRTITKEVPKASFFHYFSTPTGDEDDEEEEGKEGENEEGEEGRVKLTMEEDYDVGHTIRTAIIPEAVLWYTGETVDEEYDDYEEGDEEDDEDEEEDEEEDEDSEDDVKGKGKKGGAKKGGAATGFAAKAPAAGGPAGEQPECKQN